MNNLKELYLTYPVEKLFFELTKDIVILIDEKEYPNRIFYFRDNNCIFEYDKNNGYFWCSYYNYWLIFEDKFGFNYEQIKALTKDEVEKHFKLKGITPVNYFNIPISWVKKHFKLSEITPRLEKTKTSVLGGKIF
jgi:hypothetical protein